jgi:hypothetical protein
MGLGAKGATRSSDALRRVVDDEGPAAMVRRMSRERDRDREAALAAATRMVDVESSSKMAEDHRAERRQQLARQESRRRQLSREREETSELHRTTSTGASTIKGSQLRRQDSKRQGKGKEKLSDLLASTDEASTEGSRKVTLRQKVKSPSSDDLTHPDSTTITDAPASSSPSSSPSSSASMSATEEKKEKKKTKTKTKAKASGSSPTLSPDEQAAKLGEDRRKKEKKALKKEKKEKKKSHGGSTIGPASGSGSGSGKSTTLRRKGHSGPTEVVPEDFKRLNRSVSELSPRSMTAVSKSPRTTESASPSSTPSSIDKTRTKTKKDTTKTKGSQPLLRSDEAARPTIPTTAAKRDRSVRRERSRDEEKTEKRSASKREKRSGSSSSSSSPQLPGDGAAEPKKIGTLRKLIGVKPSIQFTKSEVSIAFRRRSKSGEKEKNIISSPKPSDSSVSELRSSDSWGVRAH